MKFFGLCYARGQTGWSEWFLLYTSISPIAAELSPVATHRKSDFLPIGPSCLWPALTCCLPNPPLPYGHFDWPVSGGSSRSLTRGMNGRTCEVSLIKLSPDPKEAPGPVTRTAVTIVTTWHSIDSIVLSSLVLLINRNDLYGSKSCPHTNALALQFKARESQLWQKQANLGIGLVCFNQTFKYDLYRVL